MSALALASARSAVSLARALEHGAATRPCRPRPVREEQATLTVKGIAEHSRRPGAPRDLGDDIDE